MKTLIVMMTLALGLSQAWAHEDNVDMVGMGIKEAAVAFKAEIAKRDFVTVATFSSVRGWLTGETVKAKFTVAAGKSEISFYYSCEHIEETETTNCVKEKETNEAIVKPTEDIDLDTTLNSITASLSAFEAEAKTRPADRWVEGFWAIAGYSNGGAAETGIIVINADKSKTRLTYACKQGCQKIKEEKDSQK